MRMIIADRLEQSRPGIRATELILPTRKATDRNEMEAAFIDPGRNLVSELLANRTARMLTSTWHDPNSSVPRPFRQGDQKQR